MCVLWCGVWCGVWVCVGSCGEVWGGLMPGWGEAGVRIGAHVLLSSTACQISAFEWCVDPRPGSRVRVRVGSPPPPSGQGVQSGQAPRAKCARGGGVRAEVRASARVRACRGLRAARAGRAALVALGTIHVCSAPKLARTEILGGDSRHQAACSVECAVCSVQRTGCKRGVEARGEGRRRRGAPVHEALRPNPNPNANP